LRLRSTWSRIAAVAVTSRAAQQAVDHRDSFSPALRGPGLAEKAGELFVFARDVGRKGLSALGAALE
jgi:hypothetical protein